MADCTKTEEFLREWGRMCDEYADCVMCQLRSKSDGENCDVNNLMPDVAIAIVQKWSDEHPVMTWIGKAKAAFPDLVVEGLIACLCPRDLFGNHAPGLDACTYNSGADCSKCWDGEYKEADGVRGE